MTTNSLIITLVIGIVILGALTYVTFFSKWSVNSDTQPIVSVISDEKVVKNEENDSDSIEKETKQVDQIGDVVSFTINEIPRSSESLLSIDIIVDKNDTEKYSATVSGYGLWYLTYGNSYLCFTKPTFKYDYCIEEKYLPIDSIRAFDQGIMFDDNMMIEELDDITVSVIPYNALSAFLARIETSLRALRQEGLSEGLQVAWPQNGEPFIIINNIKDGGILKNHNINSIDIVSFMNATLMKGNITSGYNFEDEDDDQYIMELANEYNLNLDDYRYNPLGAE